MVFLFEENIIKALISVFKVLFSSQTSIYTAQVLLNHKALPQLGSLLYGGHEDVFMNEIIMR